MTFGFLCLIQRPAPDFLAHIAAHAQAGDQVVLLNTSGDLQALTQLKQFAATTGWPAGVIVVEITTGTPAHLGLQCQLALSQVTTDKAIFLTDQIRLTQAFSAARHMATRADVVIGKGGSLGQIVFTPTDLPGWRANDDTLALTLMWHLSQQQVLQYPQALSTGHTGHDGTLFEALAQLITLYPQARSWVCKNLPDWIRCQMTGATLTMMPDAAKFICDLSDDTLQKIGFSTQQSLISALKAPAPATPAITGTAKPRLFFAGPHVNRNPLNYRDLAPLWRDHLIMTPDPMTADLVIYTHPRDPENATAHIANSPANFVLFSEEPFWDSLFSPDPLSANITLPIAGRGLEQMTQINHHTSAVFHFDKIPYYLLTNTRFIAAYQKMFKRNAALSPDDWAQAFQIRKTHAVFMAEHRPETFHDIAIKGGDIIGLCAWRTRLAEQTTGTVERRGASWQGGQTRFQLTDWHTDKLVQMDSYTRVLSAIENTHQPAYVSEKLFDAFACGTRPLYYASDAHLVHSLNIPDAAWINLYGLTSDAAAQMVTNTGWDAAFYAAYAQAQHRLATLFGDTDIVRAERHRLKRAVLCEISQAL